MSSSLRTIPRPELIFGIAGPIGVDISAIEDSIKAALDDVEYTTHTIKLTDEMRSFGSEIEIPDRGDFHQVMTKKMDYANDLRKRYADPAVLAMIAIRGIQLLRRQINEKSGRDPDTSLERTAFLVRQFKTPAEVNLMRQVYGRQFILISAHGRQGDRQKRLEEILKRSLPRTTGEDEITNKIHTSISRDLNESTHKFGQQLRNTFHLADVFIDGINRNEMDAMTRRFINALFGKNDISPNKQEYGMYMAKSASLRSADLSRQVGAAIITDDGDIVTLGCNEVPKAFGGTYWDSDEHDYRDIQLQFDPNDLQKKEILRDLLERLGDGGFLSRKAKSQGGSAKLVDWLIQKGAGNSADGAGTLAEAELMDLTEYGRVVHAEMSAICDAARTGKSVKNSTLFCTTFPCHNCTKHILSTGIKKVVYIEPYPKSKAKDLHANEISLEEEHPNRVSFPPFVGISPFRYRDIFQKGRRKRGDGSAAQWYHNSPQPLVETLAPVSADLERLAFHPLFGAITSGQSVTPLQAEAPETC
jgi:deoxycytidylate deaminase